MKPKDHHVSVLFTAAEVKLLCSKLCVIASLYVLCSLLLESRDFDLAPLAIEKVAQGFR